MHLRYFYYSVKTFACVEASGDVLSLISLHLLTAHFWLGSLHFCKSKTL
jgi:hypothetical protein